MSNTPPAIRGRPDHRFENWAKTYECKPALFFEPESEEQVVEIIRRARAEGKTCRAVGAGHSPSDLACTEGYMIGTDRLNRLLDVDRDAQRVTVQGGMRLHDLHRYLHKHGLALSNLGSISDQSVAGLIATATHGTGIQYGVISTMVTEITLATAAGEILTCSATQHPHIFRAAQCALGCLGIVVRVQLQCEAAFRLCATEELDHMEALLDRWHETARSAEHVRYWWFPYSDDTVVWRANRTDATPSRTPASNWLRDRLVGYYMYEFALYLSRFAPRLLTPTIERRKVAWLHQKPITVVGQSNEVFNFDCLFSQRVNEWSVPAEHAPEAIRRLRDAIRRAPYPVHFPIEIRFVAGDDIWMSPAQGRDVCYIGIIMYRPYNKPVPYKLFWREYETIMRSLGGRPHWAKAHGLVYDDLARLYPHLDEFLAVRQQLDPSGLFLNEYLRRHLLPSGKPLGQAKL
ncbi:L-gulonolactone oxidase-like protein [Thamnocephalis sphaerospora]|uniref:D-arabinono-1,4-lactone oxidase n=1 Tax=Thamnocephalis sphaerospora TaxID=78915 RepID=A0A4P9XUB0_9FUNG|nr:L-gulonolactone oxidase-like protein [Thamnocephalis sphaerospora]|eukprot:RKP09805.1 L-gulonolactone oxidase-like protein [Thamnocephalis sphaerospora]